MVANEGGPTATLPIGTILAGTACCLIRRSHTEKRRQLAGKRQVSQDVDHASHDIVESMG